MIYFIHDPENGTKFFENKLMFLRGLRDYDLQELYCDERWSIEVENVIAGKMHGKPPNGFFERNELDEYDYYSAFATHRATENILKNRPDIEKLDDEGRCEDGVYWGEFDYISDYSFELIPHKTRKDTSKCP